MSVLIRHFLNGIEFVPVNADNFTLSFTRETDDKWRQDFSTSSSVILPQEGYITLLDHLNNIGIQQAPIYNIKIGQQNNAFMADLSEGFRIAKTQAEISIKKFKAKDNVVDNLNYLTWEYLKQNGGITDADMVQIPYVVIKENQAEMLISTAIGIYIIADNIAESVAKTARLIGDLVAASTPSPAPPTVATPIGLIIRYALLIALELAKLVLLTIALRQLFKQLFELIWPSVRYYKAMTFDKLLRIGLGSENITYQSSLQNHFKKCTVIPVPIDEKKKKWFEVVETIDDRILNRGYPTSSDTIPTVMSLIDEICKMFNVRPYLRGSVLHLEPEGWLWNQPMTTLSYNKNDQEGIEQVLTCDTSEIWNTKIISYTNDSADKMLFDNPKGLRVEYKAIPNNLAPLDERTIIRGLVDIRINFALGTIKSETWLEKQVKKLAKAVDNFLGTGFLAKVKKRDGVLAVSASQFSVTKMIYQQGGKQLKDYVSIIGANALYTNWHTIDEPKNKIFRTYNDMPIPMNNEQFLFLLDNNIVSLEGVKNGEVLNCEYNPELNTANVSYRIQDKVWGKNITTIKVYEE